MTYFASTYDKDVVAGMGGVLCVELIALLPALGVSMALFSIISQNSGARAYERIDDTLRAAMICGLVLSLVGMLFLLFEAELFVGRFILKSWHSHCLGILLSIPTSRFYKVFNDLLLLCISH